MLILGLTLPCTYLSLTIQLSVFCSNLFLLAMLSTLLFSFIFLLLLFYGKICLSLLLNQIVQPYLILLDSVCMCGILKFKRVSKNCDTINNIAFLLQNLGLCIQFLATSHLEFQTGQPLISCLLQLKFPRSFLYYIGNFSYYAGIMLSAFQPLLCLK